MPPLASHDGSEPGAAVEQGEAVVSTLDSIVALNGVGGKSSLTAFLRKNRVDLPR